MASDGKICPCLYYQDAIDTKEAIVNKDTKNIKRLLKQSVINKPEKNMWNDKNSETPTRAFYYTGGVGHMGVGKIFIILNLFILKIRRFFRIFGYSG
ncbi:molybdenum cofactor biosynthesis protein MoaA [Helicobacter pylori CPY1313]|nr:molybdenum cofactor biosynthesis protein MoaA [Helicobacter pylori CPY1313]